MLKDDYKVYEDKMEKSINATAADFASVRAGRANAAEHKDDPSTWSDEAAEEAAGEAVEEAPLEDDAGGEDGE